MGLMKVMHVANQRKLEYYIELHNRDWEGKQKGEKKKNTLNKPSLYEISVALRMEDGTMYDDRD